MARQVEKELELPSGKRAVVYAGTGRDVMRAGRVVDVQQDGQVGLAFAMVAMKVEIDGHALTYEDVLDLPEADALALIGATQGDQKKPSPVTTSPSSKPRGTSRTRTS
jgi:hypothetical protein